MSVAIEKPKQQSATHSAMQKIKQLIFSGELAADSNHLESELANRLGLSRTPVREATLMLQAYGLLEVRPRKGIKIKSISVNDMAEIYDLLTELECLSVRLAANIGFASKDLKVLRNAIKDMDIALADKDLDAWSVSDEAFHTELVRLGGNDQVAQIVRNVNDQVRRARSITLHMRPLPVKSNTEHRKLCQAILKGDAEQANDIHRKHRENARDLLINVLKSAGFKRV